MKKKKKKEVMVNSLKENILKPCPEYRLSGYREKTMGMSKIVGFFGFMIPCNKRKEKEEEDEGNM